MAAFTLQTSRRTFRARILKKNVRVCVSRRVDTAAEAVAFSDRGTAGGFR